MAEPKSGHKTTELWVTVVAGVLTLFNNKIGLHLDGTTVTAIAGLVVAYTIGRSIVKVKS